MTLVSTVCFGICIGIILSLFRRGADFLSPARVFGFIWSFSIGLADFKFSALQHDWSLQGWILLLTGVMAFLLGTFAAYILNINRKLVSISEMRRLLREEEVYEGRLFWLICLSVAIYGASFLANYLIKGWLPIFTIGTSLSRVEYNVSGLTLFLYSAAFIIFFTVLYHILVRGRRGRKIFLTAICLIAVGSYLLLLSRYQIIMAIVICVSLLYYATRHIRLRTALSLLLGVVAFFYWIASLRVSHLVSTYIYSVSKMRFSRDFAFLTEPYMYFVMNLENFAHSVNVADKHTYGYFTLDFITAIFGLKYWIFEYFGMDRFPYITSSYNTYTALWWFYSDFGVIGLALILWMLGLSAGLLYYRMRSRPTIKNVTAYGVAVFVMFISYFNFPISFLWFEYNLLVMYLFLRWTIVPREDYTRSNFT